MVRSVKIALTSLSLLAADAIGQEISARPSCRLLVDKVEEYDDATVGLMCRRSIDAKQCSAMISALGSRPWSKPKREAACEHFEEDLLRRRILFDFPKLPSLSKLAEDFASQADQVTKQGQSKALESATAMIDQAVSMVDEASGMTDTRLANSTMDSVTAAKKNVSSSLGEVHKSADDAKKALREDLIDSVGQLTTQSENFTEELNEEVSKQMGKFQSALNQNQDILNEMLSQASKGQMSATDAKNDFLSSWNNNLDKTSNPEVEKLANDTNNAMSGLQDLLKGLPKDVKVQDLLKGLPKDVEVPDFLKGNLTEEKYEKNQAIEISNGSVFSFAGFLVLAAAITGATVQRLRQRERQSLRVASTVLVEDEEGGAE